MKWLLLLSELKNDNILRVEINGSLERSFATVYEMRIYITVQQEEVWIYVGYASINDCIAKRKYMYTELQSKRL